MAELVLGATSIRHGRNELESVISSCAAGLLFTAFCFLTCIPLVYTQESSGKTQSNVSNELEIAGWEEGESRDPKRFLDSFKYTISGQKICRNLNTKLVIIVTAPPAGFSSRALIRETWASLKVHHVKVGFLVGLTSDREIQSCLEEESERFKDIIQVDIMDTYNNLTLKSISLLEWYIKRCPVPSILMKADDDTFIDVKMIVRQLKEYPLQHGILLGCLFRNASVIRDVHEKNSVPKYMFKEIVYPDYLSGSAYLMSWDVARRLYSAALETPVFHLEDVYITGICAENAGVTPRSFEGVSVYVGHPEINCLPHHATCHPVNPESMRTMWQWRIPW